MNKSFVHLRVHSEYSLIDSVVSIKPLVSRTAELGMPAVAITDQCNFFGLVKFYTAALSAGIKPIIGSDFYLIDEENPDEHSLITLLAMNEKGYKNITEIISLAYLKEQSLGIARIRWQWLEEFNEGVIALSGAKYGAIGQQLLRGRLDTAQATLERMMALYPERFYIELQRTSRVDDENYLHLAVDLAAKMQCPVVASNDVRFLHSDSFDAHEARVCIHDSETLDDPKRVRRYSPEQYLRSAEEMCELFADIPSAIENTVEIAKRCNATIHLGEYFLPAYPIPEGMTQEEFFRKVSHDGLTERLEFLFDTTEEGFAEKEKEYRQRLDFELDIILQMGFPGYFLIVMDFIAWAKEQNIPVGPGRGSGAGSLVAYALKITDLDPLEYDLLFERFLNPERVSMPDFDIDFCMDQRGKVIQYVSERYGEMAVSQIATFGTMAAKAVVRDVARVQGKPYGLADRLSKMIPFDVGITLKKAYEQEAALRDMLATDEMAKEIWDMALELEGTIRNVGRHAGGVVIAPEKLTDFSPIYCDELGGAKVTQFDKDDVEKAGLVKFDFLGLRTLTIIDWALAIINQQKQESGQDLIDIDRIPLDDKPTYQLLKNAETTAVFQLESRGMKELIKKLSPDNIEDLIALVALFRPGPLDSGMVDDFVNRKHGRAEVAYPDAKYQHEWLKPILEPTYGVIVYQEQVMQIAQELAGYSLGGADLLRRAMGNKKVEEMDQQRAIFREGAIKKGVDPDLATRIFDLVEKFAGYGFNKSHSAAYAMVSYQTAWLKCHYPAPFMAAVMSSELHNTEKIVIFIDESRRMGLTIRNPDINQGDYQFSVVKNEQGEDEIVYGLGAIKGLGEGPIEAIIEARQQGPFTDLFDFCARVDMRRMNKRALEALIRAGGFDDLSSMDDRAMLMEALPEAIKAAEQERQNINTGMVDLFAEVEQEQDIDVYINVRKTPPYSVTERLKGEKDTLGLYLTGHLIDEYADEVSQWFKAGRCKPIKDLEADTDTTTIAGIVIDMREIRTKRGDTICALTLDDKTSQTEVTLFSKAYEQVKELIAVDKLLFFTGRAEYDSYRDALRFRVDEVIDLIEMRSRRRILIHLDKQQEPLEKFRQLEPLIAEKSERNCFVMIEYALDQDSQVRMQLDKKWGISPSEDVIQQVQKIVGRECVKFL